MTYDVKEASATGGSPVEGYQFLGTFANYYYTSAELDVTINGQLYTAAIIKRNVINSGTQSDDQLDLQLEVPRNLQLIQDYAFQSSPPDLRLKIYRYHEGDNPAIDWVIIWDGKVTSFSVTGHQARILVPSVFSLALRGTVPSKSYHAPCNHVLYDARCKVLRTSFKQVTTITALNPSGNTVTVADDGFADGVLEGGEVFNTTQGERRLILANVANVLTVSFPFHSAIVGDTVELYAGCDHSRLGDCLNRFNNVVNFGGFPLVPKVNPFEGEL